MVRFLQLLIEIYPGAGWLNSSWSHTVCDRVLMVLGKKIPRVRVTSYKVHISLCYFLSWIKYTKLTALLWARRCLHALQWWFQSKLFFPWGLKERKVTHCSTRLSGLSMIYDTFTLINQKTFLHFLVFCLLNKNSGFFVCLVWFGFIGIIYSVSELFRIQ